MVNDLLSVRHIQRHIQRQIDRQTDRQIDRQTDRQIDRQTDRQIDRQTDRQIDRQTDRQIDRQTDRQIDRQTDRQIDRHCEKGKKCFWFVYSCLFGGTDRNNNFYRKSLSDGIVFEFAFSKLFKNFSPTFLGWGEPYKSQGGIFCS